eukprot:TRINITY_DN30418_c0_g1_i2.p1 TRINITY_DN30418_c0_g1~~TRINITY_DN30418_c0_g1_i2.p1  ORF type:complete len:235 (+),score=44.04 TRINITY_DN30418_c0_g1_i2:101-706(+)
MSVMGRVISAPGVAPSCGGMDPYGAAYGWGMAPMPYDWVQQCWWQGVVPMQPMYGQGYSEGDASDSDTEIEVVACPGSYAHGLPQWSQPVHGGQSLMHHPHCMTTLAQGPPPCASPPHYPCPSNTSGDTGESEEEVAVDIIAPSSGPQSPNRSLGCGRSRASSEPGTPRRARSALEDEAHRPTARVRSHSTPPVVSATTEC